VAVAAVVAVVVAGVKDAFGPGALVRVCGGGTIPPAPERPLAPAMLGPPPPTLFTMLSPLTFKAPGLTKKCRKYIRQLSL
jgi:hypothetical protein